MDTPTPDSPKPKPSASLSALAKTPLTLEKSIVVVLGAALIIIPGLCFGIAVPLGRDGAVMGLFELWLLVALIVLVRGLVQLMARIFRSLFG